MSTSHLRQPAGSTWSNDGSPPSPTNSYVGIASDRHVNWRPPSKAISINTIHNPSPLFGQNLLTRSSIPSHGTAGVLMTQDTSGLPQPSDVFRSCPAFRGRDQPRVAVLSDAERITPALTHFRFSAQFGA